MKTINRGWLKKQVKKGNIEMVSSRHFDDMHGESTTKKTIPVKLGGEFAEGICTLHDSDFKTKSGAAWKNPDETIALCIHSNLTMDLKIKEAFNGYLPTK